VEGKIARQPPQPQWQPPAECNENSRRQQHQSNDDQRSAEGHVFIVEAESAGVAPRLKPERRPSYVGSQAWTQMPIVFVFVTDTDTFTLPFDPQGGNPGIGGSVTLIW
jgi:hypothetical protein